MDTAVCTDGRKKRIGWILDEEIARLGEGKPGRKA
jgi:hypothetical protein